MDLQSRKSLLDFLSAEEDIGVIQFVSDIFERTLPAYG